MGPGTHKLKVIVYETPGAADGEAPYEGKISPGNDHSQSLVTKGGASRAEGAGWFKAT